MTDLRTADRGDIRDLNILAVINLFRRLGSTTRATIARETGLSAPTVSAVVATLGRAGLVDVSGAGPATGGRRGELVAFRPDAKLVLAIDLSSEPRRCALVDLARQLVPGSVADIPQRALTAPVQFARWVARRLSSQPQVVGIGVAVPGVTDARRGIIEWAPSLGWRNANVKVELERALPGLVVTVENDLNLAALAEHVLGKAGWQDLAMLGLRGGFGAGIILGGKLHRGVNFAAGELGYLPAPSGKPGTLDFGSLEATLFSMLPGRDLPRLDITAKNLSVAAPPLLSSADMARVTEIVALGSSAVAVVLNVSAIILGEELLALVPRLDHLVAEKLAAALPHPPQIVPSVLGSVGTLQGAAAAVQHDIEADVRRLCVMIFVGLDIGGSKSEGIAATEREVLSHIRGPGSNLHQEGLLATTRSILDLVTQAVPSGSANDIRAAVCIAGLDTEVSRQQLLRSLTEAEPAVTWGAENDALAAWKGAMGSRSAGVIAIAGTGAVAYARDGTRQARAGGWGALLGDEGSGYSLGRGALIAVLREQDGLGPRTSLTRVVLRRLGITRAEEIVDLVHFRMTPFDVAALAPIVLDEAMADDAEARRIVDEAGSALVETARAAADGVSPQGPISFSVVGGLSRSAFYLERLKVFAGAHADRIAWHAPDASPVVGALDLAFESGGRSASALASQLRSLS